MISVANSQTMPPHSHHFFIYKVEIIICLPHRIISCINHQAQCLALYFVDVSFSKNVDYVTVLNPQLFNMEKGDHPNYLMNENDV